MSRSKTLLNETTIENSDTILLLSIAAQEDRNNKHIWNLSDNALAWEDYRAFHDYLCKDFGDYYLYIAHHENRPLGVFGMLKLSDCVGSANILVWIDQSCRKRLSVMKWFVLFLREAQERSVVNWYAKIKLTNAVSLHSSQRYGFKQCSFVPEHLITTQPQNGIVRCVTRNTSFNAFERKYISREMPFILKENA